MRTIVQYFDLITSITERSGAASIEIEFDQVDTTTGIVDGALYFYDGSRLEFTERVSIQDRRPIKTVYRYQYIRADHPLFRYDTPLIIPAYGTSHIISMLALRDCLRKSRR